MRAEKRLDDVDGDVHEAQTAHVAERAARCSLEGRILDIVASMVPVDAAAMAA